MCTNINMILRTEQTLWTKCVLEPFISQGYDESFSRPFYYGVSDRLESGKKHVMVVGQEADQFWKYEDTEKTLEHIQNWCVGYFDKQMWNIPFAEYDEFNGSAFWRFFRFLDSEGLNTSWNNLDKLHCYEMTREGNDEHEVTKVLSDEYRRKLSSQFGEEKKSLLQREIKLVKPDSIVFITGPRYAVSMCTAFGISEDSLNHLYPSKDEPCKKIDKVLNLDIPVYWTYHPGYLSRIKAMESVVGQVVLGL